jgi:hypothetical protein
MNGLVVGTKWYKALPAEYQQILQEECVKAGDYVTQMVLESEKDYEKKMVAEKGDGQHGGPRTLQGERGKGVCGARLRGIAEKVNRVLGK